MVELYFLFYRVPKMMSMLARERRRSAVAWSVAAILAWLGAEFFVMFGFGLVYGAGEALLGWPEQIPAGLTFLVYLLAPGAAILSLTLVRRILYAKSGLEELPLPPSPRPVFRQFS